MKKVMIRIIPSVYTFVLYYVCLIPLQTPPEINFQGLDKIMHFLSHFILCLLYSYQFPMRWLLIIISLFVGTSIEILQDMGLHRQFEVWDIVANTLGCFTFILITLKSRFNLMLKNRLTSFFPFLFLISTMISCSLFQKELYRGISYSERNEIRQQIQNKTPSEVIKLLGRPIYKGNSEHFYELIYIHGESQTKEQFQNMKHSQCFAFEFSKLNAMVFRGSYIKEVRCHEYKHRLKLDRTTLDQDVENEV